MPKSNAFALEQERIACNISSIESLGPTQKLGLKGGFEITSGQERISK
jgi:hypothetical protein